MKKFLLSASVVALSLIAQPLWAEDSALSSMLQGAPQGAAGVFLAPVAQEFLGEADAMARLPFVASFLDEEAATLAASGEPLAGLIELTTGTTLGQVIEAANIDGERPAAIYFGPDLEPAAFVIPSKGGEGMLAAVGETLQGGAESEDIAGQEVWYNADQLVGYFERDASVVFGMTRDALEDLAAKKTRADAWHYGTESFPSMDELALVVDPKVLAKQQQLREDANTAAIADALAAQFNEFAAGINLSEDAAKLRLAAHDTTPLPVGDLAPLTLASVLTKDALGVASIRLSQGVRDFITSIIKAATNNNPQASNISGMIMGVLGEELTIGVTGETPDGQPAYLALLSVQDSPQVMVFSTLAGLGAAPEDTHKGVNIQFGDGLIKDFGIKSAQIGNVIALSNDLAQIKKFIDQEGKPAAEPIAVPAEVKERGNHGFIYTPDKRGLELLGKVLQRPLPDDLGDDLGPTSLTLEGHEGWRQMALTAPNAETLSALIATE